MKRKSISHLEQCRTQLRDTSFQASFGYRRCRLKAEANGFCKRHNKERADWDARKALNPEKGS